FLSFLFLSFFFFSSRRRHTRWPRDWSSDVCSSDLSFSCTSCFARARGCCQKSFASRNTKLGCAASSSSGGSCCCWDSPLTFVGTSPVGSLTSEASTQVEDSTPQSLASQQIGCGHVCC